MQPPNSGPESGEIQKKSVFDRLGRRFDSGYSMNRRSPYGDHQPPMAQLINEPEFNNNGRFGRDPIFDPDWHYQNERRQMAMNQARHPHTPPQYIPMPPHYEMEPPGRQPPYHTGMLPYHNSSGRSSGPPMGPGIMTMNPQQRRPSPKYDRHGNLMRSPMMRMDHGSGMPPPGVFLPNPMVHPNYDMGPLRQGPNPMQQSHRWLDNPDMGSPNALNRAMPHDQFLEPHRYQMSQPPQQPQMLNNDGPSKGPSMAPRYTKWRERRDVITNLDRETAQSSSRTDSLKSTLQQTDKSKKSSQESKNPTKDNESSKVVSKKPAGQKTDSTKPSEKREPQDISDGEIIDDEDSSDDSEVLDNDQLSKSNPDDRLLGRTPSSKREAIQVGYDPVKRRRIADDCAMDYETISDEELDVFMSEKKSTDRRDDPSHKSSSEIELLKALGLDWAHLVEMSKQTKKESSNTTYSALRRFSLPNYLPTLGIKRELAGAEIYNIVEKICN